MQVGLVFDDHLPQASHDISNSNTSGILQILRIGNTHYQSRRNNSLVFIWPGTGIGYLRRSMCLI